MRDIKFRAWEKKGKAYINGFNMIGYSTGEGALKRKLQRYGNEWKIEDVDLEQYTGLKDKNGKEIYGGDIIVQIHPNGDQLTPMVIYWREGSAGFFAHTKTHGHYMLDSCIYEETMEIIGNIHEDPKLLKKTDK